MKLVLTGFSQGVRLADVADVRYFLTFEDADGNEHRLPVPKETSEALIALVYGAELKVPAPEKVDAPFEDDTSDATEFGGIEGPQEEKEEIPEYIESSEDTGPSNEEEIPSL